MKKVAFYTLGCKVNTYETNVMASLFREAGYEVVDFESFADVYVVNTCTVTNMSERKSRQMLRRAKEINPNSILCVVGCYVQVAAQELANLPEIDILLGTNDRKNIVQCVQKYANQKIQIVSDIMHCQPYVEWGGMAYTTHERAEVKIQDGCDRFCTYCMIPYARGPVRSRESQKIIEEVKCLATHGIKEIVITGIHIASYGKDLKTGETLIDILEKLEAIEGIRRIRLGSLEPLIITEEFVTRMKKLNKICPHFHLSLQSGCDETLKRMNRRYTTEEFRQIVQLLRQHFPQVALTTDIIVGFPGETKEEFQTSYQFLKEIQFAKMHIFSYSPRKGTKAATFPNQVDGKEKNKRSEILIALSHENEEKFATPYLGQEIEVLFENEEEGHTANYLKVIDTKQKHIAGEFAKVIPNKYEEECLKIE